jgi:Effector-associated domain 1
VSEESPEASVSGALRPLTAAQVRALAETFPTEDDAAQLLVAIGLPRGRQPNWRARSAEEFWWEVSELLGAGALVDGCDRLLAEAGRQRPGNSVFASGPPAGAEPGRRPGRRLPPWRRHGDRSPAARVLVVAVPLSGVIVVAAVLAIRAFGSSGGGPALQVASLATDQETSVSAGAFSAGAGSTPGNSASPASEIDIVLRNAGHAPALVTGIDVRLLAAKRLEVCSGFGGAVPVSANYNVLVPSPEEAAELGDGNALAVPSTRHINIAYQVAPNSTDHLQLTIGPAGYVDFRGPPWIYVADIYLDHDGGRRPLFAGSAAVSSPLLPGFIEYTDLMGYTAGQISCAQRDLGVLTGASKAKARGPLHVTPEITIFSQQLGYEVRQAGREYSSCGPDALRNGPGEILYTSGPVSCGAARSVLEKYLQIPSGQLSGILAEYSSGDWYCVRPAGAGNDHGIRCSNEHTDAIARLNDS